MDMQSGEGGGLRKLTLDVITLGLTREVNVILFLLIGINIGFSNIHLFERKSLNKNLILYDICQ